MKALSAKIPRLTRWLSLLLSASTISALIILPTEFSHATVVSCTPTKNLVLLLDARNTRSNTGSGSTWKDISGCGLDATLNNGPTRTTDQGGAFQFSRNSQQWAQTNSPGDLKPYTVEAYYKVDNFNSRACTAIVSDSYDSIVNNKINFTIGTFDNGDYLYGAAGPWTYTNHPSSTFGSDLTGWHIATLTYDNTNMQLYFDSATVGSAVSFSSSNMGSNGTGINIAKRWDNASNCTQTNYDNYFGGRIALVKILNKALTATEVQDEYRCITGGSTPTITMDSPGTNPKKQSLNQTITATSNCTGSVNFYYGARAIKGCTGVANVLSGSKYVATCNWKPIIHGQNSVTATISFNYYPDNQSSTTNITVLKRTTSR